PSFETIVASGWRSALPHGIASSKLLEKGDMIVFDFGCRLDGYCSDMSRTVCVGKPSAFQRKIYGVVQRAQAAGLKAIRPGKTTGAVDLAARSIIRKAGYGAHFGHGTGHGVGREVHEDPRVGPKAKDILKPGMAITCEPGIYLAGKFGVRIEDLALVTADGYENMYRTTKELIVV
ncbi:MAG TPA: M24 family metallopeptidase, partial [bacterium]|nr:M24 family metallopeptidase [bacterium]